MISADDSMSSIIGVARKTIGIVPWPSRRIPDPFRGLGPGPEGSAILKLFIDICYATDENPTPSPFVRA